MNKFLMCLVLLLSLLMVSCATYPQFRSKVSYRYSQAPLKQAANKLTKESITIEDKGKTEKVIQPIQVQACNGEQLAYRNVTKYRKTESGKVPYEVKEPIYETVDPLRNVHLRRIKIYNATEHLLHLNRIDVVLVDPSGNDHEMASKMDLKGFIRSNRPCKSTYGMFSAIDSLKLIERGKSWIRPKRAKEFLLAFPDLKINTPGVWRLQLHDIPTSSDRAGNITRKTSFEFPFQVTRYKITVEQRKDGFIKKWKEIGRKEEVVSNNK
jgi:hypothetical protein